MDAQWKPPGRLERRWLEWRAARIRDPLARLRYLRRTTSAGDVRRRGRRVPQGLLAVFLWAFLFAPGYTVSDPGLWRERRLRLPFAAGIAVPAPDRISNIWLVESRKDSETYSNGLRVETQFGTANEQRAYMIFDQTRPGISEWRSQPAGIVYHTTESHLAPFEEGQNMRLQRLGQWLLEYLRRNQSYHFLIDRFGRVHRVVRETDAANHTGKSVWAEGRWVYVNLNHSFFGVAFESQTRPGQPGDVANQAQIHAARILTDMLRSKYGIAAANCVTHAQVSVSPATMRIANHTDWAEGFPFQELGLPENYAQPLPSMFVFGFGYDSVFLELTPNSIRKSLTLAEDRMRLEATAQGISVADYRAMLRKRYRETVAALPRTDNDKENRDE